MKHLVILGNGLTGIAGARFVRKQSDMKITIISTESKHFFSRTALMYIFMGHMKYEDTKPYEDGFWEKNRIDLIRGFVKDIDCMKKCLIFSDGQEIFYDILVVATGSKSNSFNWPGYDLPGVQGLYSLQDIELLEENVKEASRAVIVGGGLIGIEMAEMVSSRKIPVTFLVREKYFWDIILPKEEAKLISRHIIEHGVDLRLKTELKEIIAGDDGRVGSIVTHEDIKIDCHLVAITIGVHPNIDIVKNSIIETGRGVLVNKYFETNVQDVYAAGDCAEIKSNGNEKSKIEQLWYTGRMQGETLAKTICGSRAAYDRGVWFNSAKFFDIEYQTYGQVKNVLQPGEKSFYWEHKNRKKCLRLVYHQDSGAFSGVNILGGRLRQTICEQWIKEKRSISFVLENLSAANFDPEFFRQDENEIIEQFNVQNPDMIMR